MRITIDPKKCIGSGNCVNAAELFFEQDADGKVSLTGKAPSEADRKTLERVVSDCPVGAISLDQ